MRQSPVNQTLLELLLLEFRINKFSEIPSKKYKANIPHSRHHYINIKHLAKWVTIILWSLGHKHYTMVTHSAVSQQTIGSPFSLC